MLRATGIVLLALSLVSAVALLLAPFNLPVPRPGAVAWILFPLLLVAGFVLAALGSSPAVVGMLFRVTGIVFLAVGCAAAAGSWRRASELSHSGAQACRSGACWSPGWRSGLPG